MVIHGLRWRKNTGLILIRFQNKMKELLKRLHLFADRASDEKVRVWPEQHFAGSVRVCCVLLAHSLQVSFDRFSHTRGGDEA